MTFPLPGTGRSAVAVPAPGRGPGCWADAPSAALDADNSLVVAYRVRNVEQRGAATIVARSDDGESLETVAVLDKDRFGAMSMERPALVRTPEAAGGSTSAARRPAASTGGSTCSRPTRRSGWPRRNRARSSPATSERA